MNSSRGYRTSEFWLNAVVTAVSAALAICMAAGVVPPTWESVITWALTQAAALGYAGYRSSVKKQEATEAANGALAITADKMAEITKMTGEQTLD